MQRAPLFFAVILVVSANIGFAELPTQSRKSIEKGTEELIAVRTSSKQFLLDRFDKQIELTRNSTKRSDEERKQLITSLEAERALFAKQEALPFSPTMRADLLAYFGKVKKAEAALAKAYDNGIEYYSRKSLRDDAQKLLTEKETALAPQVVAVWGLNLEGDKEHVYNRTLKSDGTTQNGTWTIDEEKIVLRSPNAQAPGGVWILTCLVLPDGMHLTAKNQVGNQFEGTLLVK
ncbi:MAG: hypothetical protein DWH91_00600 [Planctomycetota bacterium]|nr:MAG: hypothetical protein DWH91_00600 [Planctomycetota bacterium]